MNLKKTYRLSLQLKLFIFIFLYSFIMSILIYWKEDSSREQINFLKVVFWQLMVWIPWIIFTPFLGRFISRKSIYSGMLKHLYYALYFISPILIHWGWFVFYSNFFSPYRFVKSSRFGVFPYFFIFWSLIDILFLVTTAVYYINYQRRQDLLISESTTIQVKRGNKKVLLKNENIYWISAEGYYINIHTDKGDFLLRRTMKDILASLPKSSYIQIHRSAIINILHLTELQQSSNNKIVVVMKDGKSHSVSRSYIKSLKEILKKNSI